MLSIFCRQWAAVQRNQIKMTVMEKLHHAVGHHLARRLLPREAVTHIIIIPTIQAPPCTAKPADWLTELRGWRVEAEPHGRAAET